MVVCVGGVEWGGQLYACHGFVRENSVVEWNRVCKWNGGRVRGGSGVEGVACVVDGPAAARAIGTGVDGCLRKF